MYYYRRNSDADLREVERDWLANTSFENLHRYMNTLHRSGENGRALSILDGILTSNARDELNMIFKDNKFLASLRDYSFKLLASSVDEKDFDYSSANVTLKREKKRKQLGAFWNINFTFPMTFAGEDYNELEADDIDENTADDDGNTADTYVDEVLSVLGDVNSSLAEKWELEDGGEGDWQQSDIDVEAEDEQPVEEGYQLLDGEEVIHQSTDLSDFEAHFENLDIGQQLIVMAANIREDDSYWEVIYDVTITCKLQPYQLLAILVGAI